MGTVTSPRFSSFFAESLVFVILGTYSIPIKGLEGSSKAYQNQIEINIQEK